MSAGRYVAASSSAVIGVLAFVVVAPAAAGVAAAPVCVSSVSSPAAAVAMAAACARPVVVSSLVSEYATVSADPAGHLVLESRVLPQRVRQRDGSWREVALRLGRVGDGGLRPAVSPVDVRLSGGGSGRLVSLVGDGATLALSWPGRLPVPVVSGATATYAEVLPGVDLVVRVTVDGFSHVLVVKTAAAAANPALGRVEFGLSGDALVTRAGDGRLVGRSRRGAVLATAAAATMWDSGAAPAARGGGAGVRSAVVEAAGGRSSVAGPGDGARVAVVGAAITGDRRLRLTPDVAMLRSAPAGVFPVFIDPAWSVGKAKWAYATSNSSTNSTDYARVGREPTTGVLYRSFFNFSLTNSGQVYLGGRQILSARVHMNVYHTWSCADTGNWMFQSSPVTATMRTSWTGTKLQSVLDYAASHAHKGANDCGNQPDMPVDFTSSLVTTAVQTQATARATSITFGFCGCSTTTGTGETTQERYKKYYPNDAALVVTYNSTPTVPTALTVRESTTDYACPASPSAG